MNKRKFLFVCLWIFLIIAAAEIFLRLTGAVYLNLLNIHYKNSVSWKDDSIKILCLGESSTAGLGVSKKFSYPALLENFLSKEYPSKEIHVVVPPHVGQNTSQVANRIKQHIKTFKPQIIILMVGFNNEWSLAESHITQFIQNDSKEALKIKILTFLDQFRMCKVARYLYLRFFVRENSGYVEGLKNLQYVWGGPELVRYPPKKWIYSFAQAHQKEFIELWRYDVRKIIKQAKKENIKVVLMTYHINPSYLPLEEFVNMAKEENILLVRNDFLFEPFMKKNVMDQLLLNDGWHLNSKGYFILAENLTNIIKQNYLK